MDRAQETTLEAFERAPIAMQILRLAEAGDPGSFYPVACNRACCDALGHDIKADLGKPWRETSPELADSRFGKMFVEAIANNETVTWETSYGDSRFDKNWWRGIAKPLGDRTIIMCFQNVTVEKLNELELQRSHRELDRFAYIASHDLKAPLRDIDNLARWVLEDAETLPAASVRHLEQLRQRTRRLETLLVDLLDFSRAGRRKDPPERFRLDAVYRNVEESVPVPDGFSVHFRGGDIELAAPRSPLETVLRNLVGNALKHHDRASGEVTVSARVKGDVIEFKVEDDGPGIPPNLHDKAFEMFQTLRPRDQVEGSGLGLSLVEKLVEAYGDDLQLAPAQGRGCTFSFSWPLGLPKAPAPAPDTAAR